MSENQGFQPRVCIQHVRACSPCTGKLEACPVRLDAYLVCGRCLASEHLQNAQKAYTYKMRSETPFGRRPEIQCYDRMKDRSLQMWKTPSILPPLLNYFVRSKRCVGPGHSNQRPGAVPAMVINQRPGAVPAISQIAYRGQSFWSHILALRVSLGCEPKLLMIYTGESYDNLLQASETNCVVLYTSTRCQPCGFRSPFFTDFSEAKMEPTIRPKNGSLKPNCVSGAKFLVPYFGAAFKPVVGGCGLWESRFCH